MEKNTAVFYRENVMPIGGYFGPYRDKDNNVLNRNDGKVYNFITDDIFQKIQESGINLIVSSANGYSDKNQLGTKAVIDNLVLAEKYDIAIYIKDERMNSEMTESEILNCLENYNCYSSFKGITVRDEPTSQEYPWKSGESSLLSNYSGIATTLNRSDKYIGYVNLLPLWENNYLGDEDHYKKYIDEYVKECDARMISFDYYLYDKKFVSKKGYFKNLSIIREKSLKYSIPFWTFVQAGGNWNDADSYGKHIDRNTFYDNKTPTLGELLWNVNTSLAYGAKGIQYFPLIQPFWFAYAPDNKFDYERNGVIAADGSLTKWYKYIKEANKQIEAVDEVLINASSKVILAVGDAAQKALGITKTVDGVLQTVTVSNPSMGTIIGVFEYQGRDVFYVTNYDSGESQTITLKFKSIQQYRLISRYSNSKCDNMYCYLSLAPGDAELVIM